METVLKKVQLKITLKRNPSVLCTNENLTVDQLCPCHTLNDAIKEYLSKIPTVGIVLKKPKGPAPRKKKQFVFTKNFTYMSFLYFFVSSHEEW